MRDYPWIVVVSISLQSRERLGILGCRLTFRNRNWRNTVKLRGDGQKTKVCSKEQKPLGWGFGFKNHDLPDLWLWLLAHGADHVQELTLWPEQGVCSFLSSKLVYAIEGWPLEAGFPFSNKNSVVISCFTSCIEMLNMLGVVIFLTYHYIVR